MGYRALPTRLEPAATEKSVATNAAPECGPADQSACKPGTSPARSRSTHLKAAALVALGLVALLLLGWRMTPAGTDGRLYLLTPGNRAIALYLGESGRWAAVVSALMDDMCSLAAGAHHDFYATSRESLSLFDRAQSLYQSIDRTSPPPSLRGLHDRYRDLASLVVTTAAAGMEYTATSGEAELAAWRQDQVTLEDAARGLAQTRAGLLAGE